MTTRGRWLTRLGAVALAAAPLPWASHTATAQSDDTVIVIATRALADDLLIHTLMQRGEPLCGVDGDGRAVEAFIVEGTFDARMDWSPVGRTAACEGGALAKCVHAGFHPWQSAEAREDHLACVRMMRADYCGDGVPHTVAGTRIRPVSGDAPPPPNLAAGWRADGATGVRRTRLPEAMAYVRKHCPERLGTPRGQRLWNE